MLILCVVRMGRCELLDDVEFHFYGAELSEFFYFGMGISLVEIISYSSICLGFRRMVVLFQQIFHSRRECRRSPSVIPGQDVSEASENVNSPRPRVPSPPIMFPPIYGHAACSLKHFFFFLETQALSACTQFHILS